MAVHFSIVPVNNSRILYNLINFLYINHNLNCWWNFHDNFKKSHKSSRGMPFSTTRAPDAGSLSCIFPFRVRVHKNPGIPLSCHACRKSLLKIYWATALSLSIFFINPHCSSAQTSLFPFTSMMPPQRSHFSPDGRCHTIKSHSGIASQP